MNTYHPDLWRQVEAHHGAIDSLAMVRNRGLLPDIVKSEQHLATMLSMVRAVVVLDEEELIRECHIFKPDPAAATITVMMHR